MRQPVCLTFALLLAVTFHAQTSQLPQRTDDLLRRANEFRRFLSAGDRVKASEYVIASQRKGFLNQTTAALESVKTVGLDFVDKDHVYVRVTGQTVVAGGTGGQMAEPMASDLWVWEKGAWYFQPVSGSVRVFTKDASADATALSEIKSNFKLLTESIDLGELWQGDRKQIPIQFQYSGTVPIRLSSKVDSPVTMLDSASIQSINKDSKQFQIVAGSDDFEGPFDIPVTFTVYYKSVSIDESVRVKGNIRPLFKVRQTPAAVAADNKQEFQVFVKNNTDEAAEFGALFDEGKFYVTDYPHHIAAGEEGIIRLKRNVTAATPGTKLNLALQNQLKGRSVYEIPIH